MSDHAPRATPAARVRAAFSFTIIVLALLTGGAVPARAGTYTVSVCDASGSNRAFAPFGDGVYVAAEPGCRPQFTGTGYQSGGMRVRNSVNAPGVGATAPLFANGGLRAQAPAGTTITRVRGSAASYDDMGSTFTDGWRAGIADDIGSLWCGLRQGCSWSGPPMLGVDLTPSPGATRIDLFVTCAVWTGCSRDRLRGVVNFDGATLDVSDAVAPQVSVAGNSWSGGWASGAITAAVGATDAAGVRRTWFTIDGGGAQQQSQFPCDPYAMAPCPADTGSNAAPLSIAALTDGRHTVNLHAEDAGYNQSSSDVPLLVDNNAPVVSAVTTLTAPAWHSTNGFDLRVTEADPAGGSGIQRTNWEVCRDDGSSCVPGSMAGAADAVRLAAPSAGAWKARFWATDALRSGVKSDWSAALRFDDIVPGAAEISGATAWTREASPSVTLGLAAGETRGPSGIAGFAVAVGSATPGQTSTADGEHPSVSLATLPEGATTVRARAIGGSGVASSVLATAQVRVDRTPPLLGVARDPDGADTDWVGRETKVAVHAADALSGMVPAAQGEPDTAGARVVYAIDGGEAVVIRGADATIALATNGDHAITVRAYDAAGNVSRERVLRVRVDRTAPTGEILARDPGRPRRLRAVIEDLCVRSAIAELRQRGDGVWHQQDATLEGREAWVDIDDDHLPAGAYDVRFRVEDCAGNVGIIDRFASQIAGSGSAQLRFPLRAQLHLQVAFDGDDPLDGRTRRTLGLSRRVRIQGWLTDADGTPTGGRVVLVQRRIMLGDWTTIATDATGVDGAIDVTLPAGPSRDLRLATEADELTVGAISRTLRVAVPARATIHVARRALRNGQVARFSGRLLGGYLPARGRELELQGYNPLRGRWQPVRTSGLRSDGHGAWRAGYRFTATRGTVRYRFRLRIPPRPDHPFANGYSRAVTVIVSG